MTGTLFQTSAMLVPIAVKASTRSSSSIGTENALIANENAANSPPTNVPTATSDAPDGVVNSVGRTSSNPGKGLSPKNSA